MKTLAIIVIAIGAIAILGAAAFASAGYLGNSPASTNQGNSCQGSGSGMMFQNNNGMMFQNNDGNMMQSKEQFGSNQEHCHDHELNYSYGNCSGS